MKCIFSILFVLLLNFTALPAFAYPDVSITAATYTALDGPAHHGISIETTGIDDPNLVFYELHIKEDSGNPNYPPYQVYNNEIHPYDMKLFTIPYRNGVLALESDEKYCVRIRAYYNTSEYSSWVENCGVELDVASASNVDWDRGVYHGGGEEYLGYAGFIWMAFEMSSDEYDFGTYDMLTFITIGEGSNTSEFSYVVPVGEDYDFDGVINRFETGDGSSESEGSYADNPDTDADGLADVVEDKNRNGVWDFDEGETSAFIADSDEDGVSDFYEVSGDNQYDPSSDTDPLGTDSDGDGLQDGSEDKNGNGILEVYLNETDPLSTDTDQDGFDDASDNCPSVYNPTQNSGYCQVAAVLEAVPFTQRV